jgi:hypothetical protein
MFPPLTACLSRRRFTRLPNTQLAGFVSNRDEQSTDTVGEVMTDEDAVKQAKQLVDAIKNLSDQQTLIAGLLRDVVMKALPSLRAEQQAAIDGLQKLTAMIEGRNGHYRAP